MATASYFQPATAFLTAAAMRAAVRLGPEGTFRGAFWPLTRSLTLLPPTSTTRIFTRAPRTRKRSPSGPASRGSRGAVVRRSHGLRREPDRAGDPRAAEAAVAAAGSSRGTAGGSPRRSRTRGPRGSPS